jgi:hypothetical protein
MLQNRVLRIISGSRRHEVTEGWRKFRNKELHNLYSPPNADMTMRMKGYERGGEWQYTCERQELQSFGQEI